MTVLRPIAGRRRMAVLRLVADGRRVQIEIDVFRRKFRIIFRVNDPAVCDNIDTGEIKLDVYLHLYKRPRSFVRGSVRNAFMI